MTRKSISTLSLLVAGLLVMSILPLGVKAAPVIEQLKHTPKFPLLTDSVNISAKITDAVAITAVELQFCSYYPPPLTGFCKNFIWTGPNATDLYYWTVEIDATSISADYVFTAVNANSETTVTDPIFIQYAFNITAGMTSDNSQPEPGQDFNLTVGAHYANNLSAPAEYSNVRIVRTNSAEEWLGVTDANGNCTIEIAAPGAAGPYTYEANVTNRTNSGLATASIVVEEESLPEIVVEAEDISISDMHPLEGANVTANITVENWGSLGATFYVDVTLAADGSTRTLANQSVTLGPSSETYIHVYWDAVVGLQYLNVTADPGNVNRETSEMNNFASVHLTGEKPTDHPQETPIFLYAIIVLIIVLILIATVLILRRRKPGVPEQ